MKIDKIYSITGKTKSVEIYMNDLYFQIFIHTIVLLILCVCMTFAGFLLTELDSKINALEQKIDTIAIAEEAAK